MKRNNIIFSVFAIAVIAVVGFLFQQFKDGFTIGCTEGHCSVNTANKKTDADPRFKDETLILDMPLPNQTLGTRVEIKGQLRGTWFYNGSVPIRLENADGVVVADGLAQADGSWASDTPVPFTAFLSFIYPQNAKRGPGKLVIIKNNTTGDPTQNEQREIPIILSDTAQ